MCYLFQNIAGSCKVTCEVRKRTKNFYKKNNKNRMYPQKNSIKEVLLFSESESTDTDDTLKGSIKRSIVSLSSDGDTAIEGNEQESVVDSRSKVDSTHDDSSVESMDIIMYPSTSLLLEIENSKKLNSKNFRARSQRFSVKEITKSKVSQSQSKIEKPLISKRSKEFSVKEISKSKVSQSQSKIEKPLISKRSKEFSNWDEISSQHKRKNKFFNNKVVLTKVKSKSKNKNLAVRRMNSKNLPGCKIFKHREPEKEVQNNKMVKVNNVSKIKNGSPVIHSLKNEYVPKSKIWNATSPKNKISEK